MATTSDETFPLAGRLGLPIFVGLRTTEIPDLQAQLAPYRQAWREAGHRRRAQRLPAHPGLRLDHGAGGDGRAAREHVRPSSRARPSWPRSAVGRAGAGPADRRRMQAERMASLTYDDVLAKKVVFGTAVRRDRPADAAARGARAGRYRGRAESGRSHPAGAGDPEPAAPHARGAARVGWKDFDVPADPVLRLPRLRAARSLADAHRRGLPEPGAADAADRRRRPDRDRGRSGPLRHRPHLERRRAVRGARDHLGPGPLRGRASRRATTPRSTWRHGLDGVAGEVSIPRRDCSTSAWPIRR